MAYAPQVSAVIDAVNRSDGTLQAGAGATIWDTVKWGGGSANWNVVSNHAEPGGSGAGVQSLFTLPDDKEIVFDLGPIPGSGYIALFFDIQDDSNAHWLIIEIGASWRLHKIVAGSSSTLQSVSWASAPTITSVDKVAIYQVNGVIRVRYMLSGAWVELPILEVSSAALGATGKVALEASGVWGVDNLLGAAATEEDGGGPGPGVTAPVTFWVDADHPDASDEYTRAQADEDHPFITPQAAALLARVGFEEDETTPWADVIKVKRSTLGSADPANTLDPDVYPPIHHLWTGGDVLPSGDNSAHTLPIRVQGVQGDDPADEWDLLPKWIPPQGKFKNWVFESASAPDTNAPSFQAGYDQGSGDDNLTTGSLTLVEDLIFRGFKFTGGGYDIRGWNNVLFDGCWTRSPLSPFAGSGNRFLDGTGFHLSYVDNSTNTELVGPIRWTNGIFDTIQGEDGLQLYGGAPSEQYAGSEVEIDHNLFMNIVGVAPFHTDSIQVLGGVDFHVHDNVFLGCDDVLLATDGHSGTIRFENNLMSGCGLPVQIQGTDEVIIRHNTSIGSFYPLTVIIFDRFALPAPPVLTLVNNLLENYDVQVEIDDASILTPNIVTASPGKDGNLTGLPELGTSARLADLPTSVPARPSLPANYELANTPEDSPGIGDGVVLDGSNGGALAADRLGRAYTTPPDIGCHQSDAGTTVAPAARPPYLIDLDPASGATDAAALTDVTLSAFPKPGETIDTVTATVHDSAGELLPAVTDIAEPDGDGVQRITIDLKYQVTPGVIEGRLDPLVEYTVHVSVEDTEGSTAAAGWTFRVQGRDGPAITRYVSGLVGLRTRRTASPMRAFTSGSFSQPTPAAGFEQAEAEIIR